MKNRVRGPRFRRIFATLVTGLVTIGTFGAAGARADYEQAAEHFGVSGEAQQLKASTAIAVNVAGAGGVEPGSIYVASPNRVLRFSPGAEGEEPAFEEAWGWGTIKSGPGLPSAEYAVTVKATSGTYVFTVLGTAQGDGHTAEGSNTITGVTTSFGAFHVGDAISGRGLPSGATITGVGNGTIQLSAPAELGIHPELFASEVTAPLQATASAADVQAALVALPGIGPGVLSVSGGPGDAEGTSPYEIAYEGAWRARRAPFPSVTDVSLAGGSPSSTVTVENTVSPNPPPAYERCGPATGNVCEPAGNSAAGEQIGNFFALRGVAVNQATGDVYVLNDSFRKETGVGFREHHLIEVFTATGTPIGEGFGDLAGPSEAIAESPEQLHVLGGVGEGGLAVTETGAVYVMDSDFASAPGTHQARIMSFEPEHPGSYESYVYAGQGKDITTSSLTPFRRIALAGPGRLVAASTQLISEYSIGGGSTPLCTKQVRSGQTIGMTANPRSGEVFYFIIGASSKLGRLGPCDLATKEFEEVQEPLSPTPATEQMYGLAVDPNLSWSPQRPEGVLYGVDSQNSGAGMGIGDIFVPAPAAPPAIEAESVADTTSASSTLQARIDPKGITVLYHFEYLSKAEYRDNGESFEGPDPAHTAPLVSGRLGGGGVGTAAATIANLTPDTEYVFRVVAQRQGCAGAASCETEGPAASFRTFPVSGPVPPDGRAYELVSPAQKQGGEVFPADETVSSCLRECKPPGSITYAIFPMQSTAGGDAVSYMGNPFSPNEGAAVTNSYISRRTPAGWQTTPMSPRRQENTAFVGYAGSLDRGVITTTGATSLAEGAPAGYPNLYLQDAGDPASPRPLLDGALFAALSGNHRPYRGPGAFLELRYAGHSPDFSAQYFEANDSLTFAGAYAPEPPDPGSSGRDLYEWRGGQLALVNVLPGNAAVASGAEFASASPETNGIAAAGRRVFWTAAGHLYIREDNRTTREIHHPGSFITASPDGLEVLLSDGCLYSLMTTSCSADLTQGEGGFLGLAGQSEDLRRIYFVDSAALAGQNERREEAELGKPNLYFYEAGIGTRFIATLVSSDGAGGTENLNDWAAAPGARTSEASLDGRFLAFASTAPLTGYRNVGPCIVEGTPENARDLHYVDAPCKEVFLYDSVAGRLTCPSCNPTGETPLGNSTLRRISGADKREWLPQPRYLTNQGRLVFDSSDRLSPRDTNGRVEDVYEAEPAGLGSCGRAAGCISLVSSGTGTVDSNFLAMDESGSNVFFTSRQRLVPADTDGLIDVYDARVGGGFPSEGEAIVPECQGEACQAPPNPPAAPNSSTSNFQGSGNVKPQTGRHCPKGKVKKHGKCVKKNNKKHSKHKRHKKHRKEATKKQARTAGRKHGGSK